MLRLRESGQVRRLVRPALVPLVSLTIAASSAALADCEPTWDVSVGQPGIGNSAVEALGVHDDGSGPALYAGGTFTIAGGQSANYVARWDGSQWGPVGEPLDWVYSFAVFDDGLGDGPVLYAGGGHPFPAVAPLQRWDGNQWTLVEGLDGVSPNVYALQVFDDGSGPALYVGGFFTGAGGETANHIARWDGENWSTLGTGMGSAVFCLTVFDDGSGPALYAGGQFQTAGGEPALRVARWDGKNWSTLGTGLGGTTVRELIEFDDGAGEGPALYAAGTFTQTGDGVAVNRVAQWDGKSWLPVGGGVGGGALSARVFDDGNGDALYVGGTFQTAGGQATPRIARWNGETWSPLGTGMDDWVLDLMPFDDGSGLALYAAGWFEIANGESTGRVARWTSCPTTIPGDLNGDGSVGVADLLILLSVWGPCSDCGDCPADLIGDCNVGVADLLVLLGNWG